MHMQTPTYSIMSLPEVPTQDTCSLYRPFNFSCPWKPKQVWQSQCSYIKPDAYLVNSPGFVRERFCSILFCIQRAFCSWQSKSHLEFYKQMPKLCLKGRNCQTRSNQSFNSSNLLITHGQCTVLATV